MRLSLLFLLLVSPVLVSAGLFSKDSGVTMLDEKGFKKVMKEERTALVAFVAPWCGHCKNMSPEYSKAAKSLTPLIPFYAVDCDDAKNRQLCGEQGVKGYPTIKGFPRGGKGVAHDYPGDRKAKPIAEWASSEVPNKVESVGKESELTKWVKKSDSKPRLLLLNSQTKLPLLWRVLSNTFKDKAAFSMSRAKDKIPGLTASLNVSVEVTDKSKILYWAPGASEPQVYEGVLKYEPLSKFVNELLEGAKHSKEEL
ncbi:related to MPD1-Disulfide isomerase related protein [Serendipita indica DSM 11827]|uniref:Related to MPD1-Disulfide isomerase related protein n=1 Tax=Serendipita indica (strain DSM 11827) TaxID=1109443 RepID=G4TBP3_SERID|nr:related to MPD1-Disulfide isomerase related protein [Serendipita indica DSM 11827]